MNFFIHNCFIRFDLARNEDDVYDVKFEVNDENKFDNPQNSMLSHFILPLIFLQRSPINFLFIVVLFILI
jgi:hypothetical protein